MGPRFRSLPLRGLIDSTQYPASMPGKALKLPFASGFLPNEATAVITMFRPLKPANLPAAGRG